MKAPSVTVVGAEQALDAEELARACGAEQAWVVQLVRVGIVETQHGQGEGRQAAEDPRAWRFDSQALRLALEARRLQHDFDASLDAAALILDMSREIQRLRSRLRVLGLDTDPH